MGQSVSKGFKAFEKNDYATAKSIFSSVLAENEGDVAANFGMSRYYGISATQEKNKEKALEYLEKAEANYPFDDAKAQGKYIKLGISQVEMETRREQIEKSILEDAKKANTVAAYEEFLGRFPESKVVMTATNYRNKVAYANALKAGSVAALDAYIEKYPDAYEVTKAVPTRNKMAAKVALETNTEAGFQHFLEHYPDAPQAPQMDQRLNAVAFESAKAVGTAQAFEAYIQNYPESIFLGQAKEKLDWLKSKEGN